MSTCESQLHLILVVYLEQLLKSVLSLQTERVTYLIGWTLGGNEKEMPS